MTLSPTGHVSPLALERFTAGDMPTLPEEAARHLEDCATCQDRYAQMRSAHAHFAANVNVAARVDDILRAAAPGSRARRLPWIVAGACAFAAAAVLVVAIEPRSADMALDGRLKGSGEVLEVLRKTPDGDGTVVHAGDSLHPGDAIRFRISLRKDAYVGILGIDAAQVISAYYPGGPTLERVAASRLKMLEGGVILDDTLGPERIVLVVCDFPRAVTQLREEAAAALSRAQGDPARMGTATSCRDQAVVIHKVAR